MCVTIPEQPLKKKKAIKRDTSKNTVEKPKWNSRKCSQEWRKKKIDKTSKHKAEQTENKNLNGRTKCYHINNYIKCKIKEMDWQSVLKYITQLYATVGDCVCVWIS